MSSSEIHPLRPQEAQCTASNAPGTLLLLRLVTAVSTSHQHIRRKRTGCPATRTEIPNAGDVSANWASCHVLASTRRVFISLVRLLGATVFHHVTACGHPFDKRQRDDQDSPGRIAGGWGVFWSWANTLTNQLGSVKLKGNHCCNRAMTRLPACGCIGDSAVPASIVPVTSPQLKNRHDTPRASAAAATACFAVCEAPTSA